jgi:hypothetical protein
MLVASGRVEVGADLSPASALSLDVTEGAVVAIGPGGVLDLGRQVSVDADSTLAVDSRTTAGVLWIDGRVCGSGTIATPSALRSGVVSPGADGTAVLPSCAVSAVGSPDQPVPEPASLLLLAAGLLAAAALRRPRPLRPG